MNPVHPYRVQPISYWREVRAQFEEFAAGQGMNLERASGLKCSNGWSLATYFDAATEGAWRAWANKDSWLERKGYTNVASE